MKIGSYLKMFAILWSLLLLSVMAGQTEAQTITSVAVEPANPHVAVGGAIQFKAVGTLSDGTNQVLGPASSQIESEDRHTCTVLADGRVKCWGYNFYGELGNDSTADVNTPVAVSGISRALSVATGKYHTCAVLLDGSIKCWGYNYFGQLGAGQSTGPHECNSWPCSKTPLEVSGINNAIAVAGGGYHTCALLADGSVKCWGYNQFGQLGIGQNTGPEDCGSNPCSKTPVAVNGINNAIALTAGWNHSCAMLDDSSVKCWGYNGSGELGCGYNGDVYTPVSVVGINNAAAIDAGWQHTCALLSDRTMKCWGYNGYGELGNGTRNSSNTPITVSGINTAVALASSNSLTCAALSNGSVKCWGINHYGQLGTGQNTGPETCSSFPCSTIPVDVNGISNASDIATGYWHACALLFDGTARCWGSGYLGDGANTQSNAPVEVKNLNSRWTIGFLGNVNKVAVGGNWFLGYACAVHPGGAPECWGYNGDGELGNGGNTGPETCPEASYSIPCGTFPEPVVGLGSVSDLAAGESHACAVLSAGAVNCWGDNNRGQLGNGSTFRFSTPVSVSGINSASKVAGGGSHSCAALLDGAVKCWGDNDRGQLGADPVSGPEWCGAYPFTPCSTTPVLVNGINTALNVAAGIDHSCARLSDNTVQCWGYNIRGALGNGSKNDSFAPVSVSGINEAISIASGGQHNCAVLSTGEVKCWGYNGSGQLGNGNNTGPESCDANPSVWCSTTPINAIGIGTATSVAVGRNHSCALLSNGSVQCWGDNSVGQLGDGSTIASAAPGLTRDISNAVGISAGGNNTCAVLSGGGVMCWGSNSSGQLGIATTAGPESCTYPGPNPLDPPITEPCSTVPVQVIGETASSIVWSSSNLPVATIDNRGLTTGLDYGLSTITAALGPLSGNTTLTVGTVRLYLPIILRQ